MTPRDAERLAAEVEAIGRAAFGMRPLSRTSPHVFAEDKDAVAKRCEAVARELRQLSGGASARRPDTRS